MEKLKCMNRINQLVLVLVVVLSLVSCKSEYQQYVDREMASGIKQDSLILAMRMGQTKDDFFTICWDLNKEKIISQGVGANARYVTDRDSIGGEADPISKEMLFYGIFDENEVMRGMRMT